MKLLKSLRYGLFFFVSTAISMQSNEFFEKLNDHFEQEKKAIIKYAHTNKKKASQQNTFLTSVLTTLGINQNTQPKEEELSQEIMSEEAFKRWIQDIPQKPLEIFESHKGNFLKLKKLLADAYQFSPQKLSFNESTTMNKKAKNKKKDEESENEDENESIQSVNYKQDSRLRDILTYMKNHVEHGLTKSKVYRESELINVEGLIPLLIHEKIIGHVSDKHHHSMEDLLKDRRTVFEEHAKGEKEVQGKISLLTLKSKNLFWYSNLWKYFLWGLVSWKIIPFLTNENIKKFFSMLGIDRIEKHKPIDHEEQHDELYDPNKKSWLVTTLVKMGISSVTAVIGGIAKNIHEQRTLKKELAKLEKELVAHGTIINNIKEFDKIHHIIEEFLSEKEKEVKE